MSEWWNWLVANVGPSLNGIVEIAVLAVAVYFVIMLFRGTRGEEVMWGFVIVGGGLFLVSRALELQEISWMLQRMAGYFAIAAIVVFHPEIRRALAEVGKTHGAPDIEVSDKTMAEVEEAVERLSDGKIGALIAIERENTLQPLQEGGRVLDATVTADLLCTIFYPGTALHDGGVVIRKDRLLRAGCMFPMATVHGDVERNVEGGGRMSMGRLGMRHRAALGLSEDTDAIVIVVSEETGAIRIATDRKLTDALDIAALHKILNAFFGKDSTAHSREAKRAGGHSWGAWLRRLRGKAEGKGNPAASAPHADAPAAPAPAAAEAGAAAPPEDPAP